MAATRGINGVSYLTVNNALGLVSYYWEESAAARVQHRLLPSIVQSGVE